MKYDYVIIIFWVIVFTLLAIFTYNAKIWTSFWISIFFLLIWTPTALWMIKNKRL